MTVGVCARYRVAWVGGSYDRGCVCTIQSSVGGGAHMTEGCVCTIQQHDMHFQQQQIYCERSLMRRPYIRAYYNLDISALLGYY